METSFLGKLKEKRKNLTALGPLAVDYLWYCLMPSHDITCEAVQLKRSSFCGIYNDNCN